MKLRVLLPGLICCFAFAVSSTNAEETSTTTIELPFRTFAEIMTGDTTLPKEIEAGTAKVEGSQEALTEVIGSFDKVAKDEANPGHLHN
jgi:alkyl sulfatase BDS1-like metallo-beta-lactamase superfamily hydrolase